jgi:hypothetical protein
MVWPSGEDRVLSERLCTVIRRGSVPRSDCRHDVVHGPLHWARAQDIRFHADQSTTNGAFHGTFFYTLLHSHKDLALKHKHPQHEQLDRIVRKLPVRQRVAALGDALLTASVHERDAHALQLIETAGFASSNNNLHRAAGPIELFTGLSTRLNARSADEALLALARGWLQLSDPMRDIAAALGRQRWINAAEKLKSDPAPGSRLAALAIAEDTADPGFGRLVCQLLGDEQQSVRAAADRALLRLTVTMLGHLPRAMLGDELAALAAKPRVTLHADPEIIELERVTLFEAIADAAWSFSSHRCRSALLSALLLMDRAAQTPLEHAASHRMRRLLNQRQHPSHSPMRTVLRRSAVPILRERALRWIVIGPVAQAATDRLQIAETLEEHQVVLGQATLGARPRRAERLRAIRFGARTVGGKARVEEDGFLPTPRVFAMLPDESRVGAMRLMDYANTDAQARRLYIDCAISDESAFVRHHGSKLAQGMDLVDFLYDQQSSIARSSAVRWSSVGTRPTSFHSPAWDGRNRVAEINQRSALPWVRRIAGEEHDRLSPWKSDTPVSRLHARRLMETDPVQFVRMIRDRLGDESMCCDALMLIRALAIEQRFEHDLIGMVQDNRMDARTTATAISALGRVDSESARRIVRESLAHRDDRVRANAVEIVTVSASSILEHKQDSSHRVRANALRRVINEGTSRDPNLARDAGEELATMLDDERAEHRLAGVWAAQRAIVSSARPVLGTAWRPLVERVSHLAVDEKDEKIKSRAGMCARRLLVELDETRGGGAA